MKEKFDSPETLALIRKAKEKDESAWKSLYAQYYQGVYKVCLAITRNEADAQDVSQEAFTKAFSKLKTFKKNSKFKTWIYRIAINESLMSIRPSSRLRKRFPGGQMLLEEYNENESFVPELSSRDRELENVPLRLAMRPAIESLRQNLRIPFVLQHIEGKEIKEIAKILDTTVAAVKSSVFHAKRNLREDLKPWVSRG